MTPKERAEELLDRFLSIEGADDCGNSYSCVAKQCAISCVDEILQVLWHNHEKNSEKMYRYYIEVKQEIEKF